MIYTALGAAAVIVLVPVGWLITTHNRGVKLRLTMAESRANVDVQLKRRHDLVPNLVNVCKAYAAHEQALFVAVAEARNRAVTELARTSTGYSSEAELVATMNKLIALVESYPQIKADAQFLQLQRELVSTEDLIAAARRFYNSNVRDWNVLVASFPSSLVVKGLPGYFYEVDGVDLAPVVALRS